MRILEIPVKFQKGDIIYTTKQEKVISNCSVCEGTGRIKYNDKDMRCPECMGVGKFKSDKHINMVCDNPYTISTTKISINSNGDISIKYKGYCGFTNLNRAADNLFLSKEEAQVRCDYLNKEKKFINLDEIIIKECFKESRPSLDKIQEKLEYYKTHHNNFDKLIVIDRDNVLQDGYIIYLIYKMLDNDMVKVVVE